MPSHAFLINVARGSTVDEESLINALQNNWIAGAALDVTDPEPLPSSSPLWKIENVIISPHVANPGPRYSHYLVDLFAENLRRYLDGQPLINQVDYERGY